MELESRLMYSCGCEVEKTESELKLPGRKSVNEYRHTGKVDQKAYQR